MGIKVIQERTEEQKIFHDGMYNLMQQRYELQQGQRREWDGLKQYCDFLYERAIPDTDRVRQLCSNRGHHDFKISGLRHNLKCSYKKCPFLKGTIK
jgi:hypothetical protein